MTTPPEPTTNAQPAPTPDHGPSVLEAVANLIFDTYGCGCDRHGSNGVAANCARWRRTRATLVATALSNAGFLDDIATCVMAHQEPFDFAQCETHDTTFALGDACKFQGRRMWEVFADEADEQRGLKVRAEMELENLRWEAAQAVSGARTPDGP